MINLDKLNFSICKDCAKINKQYYSETKNLDNALSRRDDLCIYRKYDELIKHNNTRYLDIIGYDYLENCKNLLRIERRLSSFKEIRNAFEINHDGNIYLNEILESKSNPIGDKFRELKLTEENLK